MRYLFLVALLGLAGCHDIARRSYVKVDINAIEGEEYEVTIKTKDKTKSAVQAEVNGKAFDLTPPEDDFPDG
jgi:hypothetical protein